MARGSSFGLAVPQLWRPSVGACSDGVCGDASGSNGSAPSTGFEFADVMELGCASGTIEAEHLTPRQQALPMRRLSVRRSKDKTEYAVHDEVDKVLLVARLRKNAREDGIDVFTAGGADAKSGAQPALRLEYDDSRELWRLSSSSCSCCRYRLARHISEAHALPRQELARMRHFSEQLDNGEGMLRMEIQIPGVLEDGCRSSALWCPLQPKEVRDQKLCVSSRLPTGGSDGASLSLDFGRGGRCRMASSKNFAVCLGEAPSHHSAEHAGARDVFQFGKMAENHYHLDFRHPFSLVEAFGAALTTTVWI